MSPLDPIAKQALHMDKHCCTMYTQEGSKAQSALLNVAADTNHEPFPCEVP